MGKPIPPPKPVLGVAVCATRSGTHMLVWSTSHAHLYGETHTQSRPVLGVAMCGMLSVAKRYLRSATVVHVCNGLPRMGFPIPPHSELLHT